MFKGMLLVVTSRLPSSDETFRQCFSTCKQAHVLITLEIYERTIEITLLRGTGRELFCLRLLFAWRTMLPVGCTMQ